MPPVGGEVPVQRGVGAGVSWVPVHLGLMSRVGSCTVRSNVQWVRVTFEPSVTDRQTHKRKHYLPASSLSGGN